jgi:hypothetical protein
MAAVYPNALELRPAILILTAKFPLRSHNLKIGWGTRRSIFIFIEREQRAAAGHYCQCPAVFPVSVVRTQWCARFRPLLVLNCSSAALLLYRS